MSGKDAIPVSQIAASPDEAAAAIHREPKLCGGFVSGCEPAHLGEIETEERIVAMNDDNIPTPQVTVHMPQMPGMTAGEQGVAGMGAPGPNVRVVTIPRWRFVLEHVIGYSYLKGLAAVMALEAGGQLEAHGDSVFGNVWFLMSRAVLPALGFIVAEGLKYEVKRRQALGLGE